MTPAIVEFNSRRKYQVHPRTMAGGPGAHRGWPGSIGEQEDACARVARAIAGEEEQRRREGEAGQAERPATDRQPGPEGLAQESRPRCRLSHNGRSSRPL